MSLGSRLEDVFFNGLILLLTLLCHPSIIIASVYRKLRPSPEHDT